MTAHREMVKWFNEASGARSAALTVGDLSEAWKQNQLMKSVMLMAEKASK